MTDGRRDLTDIGIGAARRAFALGQGQREPQAFGDFFDAGYRERRGLLDSTMQISFVQGSNQVLELTARTIRSFVGDSPVYGVFGGRQIAPIRCDGLARALLFPAA